MTPATMPERRIAGFDWVFEYQWLSGGALVDVTDATFHVLDQATGNSVVDWSVGSGHVAIADKTVTVTVPAAETVALNARKQQLRYVLALDDGAGLQPFVEGQLKTQ